MEGKNESSSKIKEAINLLSAALTEQGAEEENCYVRKLARLSDSLTEQGAEEENCYVRKPARLPDSWSSETGCS